MKKYILHFVGCLCASLFLIFAFSFCAQAGSASDPTFEKYEAQTVIDYDLNDGTLKIKWKSNGATKYYVKAILLNEKPNNYDDSQSSRAVAFLKDGTQTSSSVSFTVSKLTQYDAKYLKVAVGAIASGESTSDASWNWVGFRLIKSIVKAGTPVFTNGKADTIIDYDIADGGLIVSWKCENADCYKVKAILMDAKPNFNSSNDTAVATLYDEYPWKKTSLPFSVNDLAKASYLKVAVGAMSQDETVNEAHWAVIAFKLTDSSTTAVTHHKYSLLGGTINYAPGDYWTVDGKPCKWNGNGEHEYENCSSLSFDSSTGRFISSGGSRQCAGFALYVEHMIYGGYQTGYKLSNAYVAPGKLTAETLKSLIMLAGPGSVLRTNKDPEHSMVITSVTQNGFSIIDCNGTAGTCKIGTKTYTWDQYVDSSFGKRGIQFIRSHGNGITEIHNNPGAPTIIVEPAKCNHESFSWITIQEATVAKEGLEEKRCSQCGVTLDTRIIACLQSNTVIIPSPTPTLTSAPSPILTPSPTPTATSEPIVLQTPSSTPIYGIKNGFVQTDGSLCFYTNDEIDTTRNGLVLDSVRNAWYFCALGRVQSQYSGLAEYGGEWFYLENGKLNTARAGLVTYNGGRFMIASGRILREYSGLIMEPNTNKWYYVAAGQVVNYTGLALYDGAWFYVINGELGVNFTGEVEYDGAKFNVVNGMLVV